MKQEIMMWAVIDSVAQKVLKRPSGGMAVHARRDDARFLCGYEKRRGNTAARVHRVKVTVEGVE